LAKSLPQVRIVSAVAKPVKKEPGVFEITAVFTNEGFLPTALEMASRVKIVRPDLVEIKLSGAELAGSKAAREIGVLKSGETKEARWKVKITDPSKFEAEVFIKSTRGGIDKKTIGKLL
jgi:hypothetical protein